MARARKARLYLFVFSFALLLPPLGTGCVSITGERELPRLFESPKFALNDSTGESISTQDLSGKVLLVDFIFTRCMGPCPLMTQRMRSVQEGLEHVGLSGAESPVRLVSISVDFAYDTPEVLAEYAATWKADRETWHFLTGPEEETLELVREGFKLTVEREGSGHDMPGHMPAIVHSTNFLLIDQKGWVRAIYHLDDPDFREAILADIRSLIS